MRKLPNLQTLKGIERTMQTVSPNMSLVKRALNAIPKAPVIRIVKTLRYSINPGM